MHLLCDNPPNNAAIKAVRPILKAVNVVASNMRLKLILNMCFYNIYKTTTTQIKTPHKKMPIVRTYENDYQDGCLSEQFCHRAIERYVEQPLKLTLSRYSTFDYENYEILAELKSRKEVRHSTYPTVYINITKWHAGLMDDRNVFFFFRYYDGLYVYKQEEQELKMVHVCNKNRDRYTKGSKCYEIPTSQLEFVCDFQPPGNVVTFD